MPKRLSLTIIAFAMFVLPAVVSAAGGFTDVDDTNVFKADIDWLAATGVTKGCNPPTNDKFCPGSTVTREQMAAFMRRLATKKIVDAKTALESDTLDNKHAADIAPIAVAQVDETDGGTNATTPITVNSVSITVPSDGVLIITGGAYVAAHEDGVFGFRAFIDSTGIGASSAFDYFTTANDDSDFGEMLSYTTATAVTPGTYVVSQKLGKTSDTSSAFINGSFFYNANTMTVTFIPGGSVSASTASAGSGSMTGG